MSIQHYQIIKLSNLLIILTLSSCVKNKIDLTKAGGSSVSPQFAGALVYSSLTLNDILIKPKSNGSITTDPSGFITLVYKGNLFSLKASQVDSIPAQTASNASYSLSATDAAAINLLPSGGTYTVKDSSLINFTTSGGTAINTLNCKTANLAVNINYGIKHSAVINIIIPGATSPTGVVFAQSIPITYSGTSPVVVNQNYSLNGYTIDMTNHGTTHNTIDVLYNISIDQSSNTANVGDAVSFTETFSNVTYNSIIGYLGQQFLSPATDTVPITLFNNNLFGTGSSFTIVNPQIKVFTSNSYGLPISAHFNILEGYTPGHPAYPITGAPNPYTIPTPATIGTTAKDSFFLNNSNSNVFSLIQTFPKNIIYNVFSQSNPAGIVYNNFITDTSLFKVDLELDLPLEGTVSNFSFQDTTNYQFDIQTNIVQSITIRGLFTNGFPIDVGMRLAFVDSAYNVICELIPPINLTTPKYQLVIPSASIDATTEIVTQPTTSTSDFTIPNSAISNVNKVRHILIGATATSSNGGTTNVRFYDYYKLDVKLGVNVQTFVKF
ncbi:MAG: hypothetical protein ACYDCN_05960 [Bacteroidia bacterium]